MIAANDDHFIDNDDDFTSEFKFPSINISTKMILTKMSPFNGENGNLVTVKPRQEGFGRQTDAHVFLTKIKNEKEAEGIEDAPPNKSPQMLAKIQEYVDYHKNDPVIEDGFINKYAPIDDWDQKFIEVDNPTLLDIANTAHHMKIPGLINLCCKTIAFSMSGLTGKQLERKFLNK
jgi:S-phase kinase-associated protein 1